ncbi:holo-ACP synthase [Prosthecobacter sp.]|uniref:holo-ACP synthase n=1 Tax=Prosthecobacter sp. TaxID=1965333 RepID=UPI001DF2FE5F|nr:holo-ACP synthase [Prosthecobacter sp.]MCB1275592.1 holo-ACP synthase [Prosthecobacter sp.]
MKATGIGIDLVEVSRIRELLEKHGQRFKDRTFTAGEIAYCDACAEPAMHYAARFAAKEAAAKALGTGIWAEGVNWTDIEVVRTVSGKPEIALHGAARQHAGDATCLVSLTHTSDLAMAQVLLA